MIYFLMFIVIVASIGLIVFYLETDDVKTKSNIFALIVILHFCHAALWVAASIQPKSNRCVQR